VALKQTNCDQSNVLLARVIFASILLSAFSFFSTCIRDPSSIWDQSNIILIVTGVEVVIGTCFPIYLAPLSKYDVSKIMTLTFRCHMMSSVTWPFDSRWSIFYGWSIMTMHLSGTVMEMWHNEGALQLNRVNNWIDWFSFWWTDQCANRARPLVIGVAS